MPRVASSYRCAECDRTSLRWEGRCPACGAWNALEEDVAAAPGSKRMKPGTATVLRLRDTVAGDEPRRLLGLGDLDLVLGGGVVPGSLVLLGGAPGIGKSTLLLQVAARVCQSGGDVLYISGEESVGQVRLRAARLGDSAEEILFASESDIGFILDAATRAMPDLLCVDSVQTLSHPDSMSAPGGLSQVRECTSALQEFAKRTGVPTFLVGHVTKGGALAGPRTLEHLVDVVIYFEGPRAGENRILRATKNRFGSVGDIAVFRMAERGLEPVAEPATAFLRDRPPGISGSAVAVAIEGSRPLLVEVQALTAEARGQSPRRSVSGFPARRLAMLLAVLERRLDIPVGRADAFVNVVGGLRLGDPGADLAVLAALASAELGRPLPDGLALIGEVGLGGEVRGVASMEARIREAARAGLEAVIVPPGAHSDGSAGEIALRELAHVREIRSVLVGTEPA